MPNLRNTLLRRVEANDPTLTELRIPGEYPHVYFEKLKNNNYVTKLAITRSLLSPDDQTIAGLVQLIIENTTIQSIWIESVNINVENAKLLGESLKENRTLQKLILHRTFVDATRVACIESIADGLKYNKSLTYLEITNGLGEKGVVAILNALENNHTLQEIDYARRGTSKKLQQLLDNALESNRNRYKEATAITQLAKQSTTSEGFSEEDDRTNLNGNKRRRSISEDEVATDSNETVDSAEGPAQINEEIEFDNISNEDTPQNDGENSPENILSNAEEHVESEAEEMSGIEDSLLSPEASHRIIKNKNAMSPEEKNEIGLLGEKRAYTYFFDKYKNKYGKNPEEQMKNNIINGFKISGINKKMQRKDINYIWENAENNTTAPTDAIIITKKDGEEAPKRYIEVKATAEKTQCNATLSRNQLKTMRKHREKFTLFIAYDVHKRFPDSEKAYKVIKDPYKKLLKEAVLAKDIQSIKVKI